jgi:hydrogenase/urease accessory protein HupE
MIRSIIASLIRLMWALGLFWCAASGSARADEMRPAYLELREIAPNEFAVLFKTPMRGDARLALHVVFSGKTENLTPPSTRMTGDAAVETWRMRAVERLTGQNVSVTGLDTSVSDALVRIQFASGRGWVQRLTPQAPSAVVPEEQSGWSVAGVYLKLGIEHILTGFDHLLFVLALLLIVRNLWQLVKTVTAFTVAHSITLALATLGIVQVPSKPVEAVIALSIVFVAAEIAHARQGREGLTARAPWIVAFTFGLLHGFGFAGALNEVGLPHGHIPTALLFFNIGVEIGQLLFVVGITGLIAILRKIQPVIPRWTALVPSYSIGAVAMFWVIQRLAAF